MSRKEFKHIGELIRRNRLSKGISQDDMAAALGLKKGQAISNIERGIAGFPRKYLHQLPDLIGVGRQEIVAAMIADYRERIERKLYLGGDK